MGIVTKVKTAITGGAKAFYALQKLEYGIKHDALIKEIMHCTESGVSSEHLCENEVIVSLTTHGRRILDVAVAIESIMQGIVKPNRIILWLGEESKNEELPESLQRQMKRGLEIEYVKDVRSFTKLIPCLRKYPEAYIITIDDDIIYCYDLVEKFIKAHKKYPQNILSNRIRRCILDKKGMPIDFYKWKTSDLPDDDSPLNFFSGFCGVFYPPHSLHEEIFNEEVFLDICKHADDIWFNAMALMQGTRARKCIVHNIDTLDILTNPNIQDIGLFSLFNGSSNMIGNQIQFDAVFKKYNLYKNLYNPQ